MLKLKKIAVTGGLAAGKTTACRIFKELGAYVISADEIVRRLLSPETAVGQRVVRLLGSDIISGQELDRNKISAKVFSQPDILRALEGIIHPAVFDEIERKYQQINREKKYSLFLAEIPLLYESKGEQRFDVVVSIFASPELCQERFIRQTHQPLQEFQRRMERQIEPIAKAGKAHYSIENNGDLEQLKANIKILYSELTKTEESDFQ